LQPCLKIFLLVAFSLAMFSAAAQLTIIGTVYDSTRLIPVKEVIINSTSGTTAISDTNGKYQIVTKENDSLTFIYNQKATLRFAVNKIENPANFEIALHIRVKEKYKTMKEVIVFSKNYRQDSLENRKQYASIFNYSKGGVKTSMDATTGVAGLDINELVNLFRFRRNRQLASMQKRLKEQEEENYINYRFNKPTVKRITRLEGTDLDFFMKAYRPDFEFTKNSSMVLFYQYILNASYHYKARKLMGQEKEKTKMP